MEVRIGLGSGSESGSLRVRARVRGVLHEFTHSCFYSRLGQIAIFSHRHIQMVIFRMPSSDSHIQIAIFSHGGA